jgi:small GTP-binding protein
MEKWPFYEDYSIKIIVIGDHNVGKTTLIKDFVSLNKVTPTIGINYYSKLIETDKGLINLTIIDPCGQDYNNEMIKSSMRECEGIIFVYDISSQKSFDKIKKWIEYVSNYHYEFILIENKIELYYNIKEKQQLISKYHINFFQYGYYEGFGKKGDPIICLIKRIFKNKLLSPKRNNQITNSNNLQNDYFYYQSHDYDIIINKNNCMS